jgi:hypothetical protein
MSSSAVNQVHISQELVDNLKLWTSCDDELRKINPKIRELRMKKKECENTILRLINENDIDNNSTFTLKDKSIISQNVAHKKQPLSLDYIKSVISSCTNDNAMTEYIIKQLNDNRSVMEKNKLKREMPKLDMKNISLHS